jgi:phenylpyruvate tautomerase PptA (4-oxalocrotonate tautomerase family)
MPNILVRIPAGVFDHGARNKLSDALNRVAADAEGIPDDPAKRFLCWVEIEEIARGNWTCGGNDVTSRLIPVLMNIHVPAGVLDDAARARYADGAHQAVVSALPHEKRKILSSCIFNEVPDGTWGVNGALWRLEDFAAAAGYRHLQHLSRDKSANQPPPA